MNYIIVGGSGFIGSHLAQMLVKECKTEHDTVIVLDIVMRVNRAWCQGLLRRWKAYSTFAVMYASLFI